MTLTWPGNLWMPRRGLQNSDFFAVWFLVGYTSRSLAILFLCARDHWAVGMPGLESLKLRINRNGDVNDLNVPRPIVTLEEFFEGNEDFGSIGYNFYPDQPAPPEFYELFQRIRERPDVANVLVEVSMQEMPDEWPSTDTVWILTSKTWRHGWANDSRLMNFGMAGPITSFESQSMCLCIVARWAFGGIDAA
jgi:hypothetical protein